MQQGVWCRSCNWTTLVGNDEGVHDLACFSCYKCIAKERTKCAIEGCDKYPLSGCGGYCGEHATQEQRDEKNRKRRKSI